MAGTDIERLTGRIRSLRNMQSVDNPGAAGARKISLALPNIVLVARQVCARQETAVEIARSAAQPAPAASSPP